MKDAVCSFAMAIFTAPFVSMNTGPDAARLEQVKREVKHRIGQLYEHVTGENVAASRRNCDRILRDAFESLNLRIRNGEVDTLQGLGDVCLAVYGKDFLQKSTELGPAVAGREEQVLQQVLEHTRILHSELIQRKEQEVGGLKARLLNVEKEKVLVLSMNLPTSTFLDPPNLR